MHKVYRVLVLGTGFARRVQLPVFAGHERFQVVGIASARAERARETAREFGVPHHGDDWRSLMREVAYDVLSVVTPVHLHRDPAREALRAGKHLLLEKPVGRNAAEARELAELAAAGPGASAVNHEFRYRPDVLTARRLLRDGTLGELRSVEIRNAHAFWADPEKPTYGWLSEARFGGGLLGALGSHNVDMVGFLTGQGVQAVEGQAWTMVPERRDAQNVSRKVTADDACSFLLTLDTGVRARIDITGGTWWDESIIRVHGSRGSVSLEASGIRLRRAGAETETLAPDPGADWTVTDPDIRKPLFHRLLDRFARRCDGETVPDLATLAEGVAVMQVLDAVRAGAAGSTWGGASSSSAD